MDYQQRAREICAKSAGLSADQVYVVWFCKTLQNWKALLSTDALDHHYWELTYSGDKCETYVDTYIKHGNVAVPD